MKDGTILQFAKGNIGCVVNNKIEAMSGEAVERESILYISMEWFLQRFYEMHTSSCEEVFYATNHPAFLSRHMAYLLQDLLK